MVPLVGRSRPTIIRAIVVFPEPDSPTMASDRPGARRNDTSSTATRSPNSLRRPEASRTGALLVSAITGRPQLPPAYLRAHTPGQPAIDLGEPGHGGPADVVGMRTPGRVRAFVRRGLERRQWPAGNGRQPGCGARDVRARRGEGGGVGVQRVVMQQRRGAELDYLARVHHGGPVADGGDRKSTRLNS